MCSSFVKMASKLLLFSALLLQLTSATYVHDDILVAASDSIEFLAKGSVGEKRSLLRLESYNASTIVALAYDSTIRRLFFSDKSSKLGHVFGVALNRSETTDIVHVVDKSVNESVESLAFDPVDNDLYWTDGKRKSINRLSVDDDTISMAENATVEVVHPLQGDLPRGLVVDPCTRILYWTNWNTKQPSIERSYLNGSHREVIVQHDLYMPHALGIDVTEQRLYWANNMRDSFRIETSLVDGAERRVIYEGRGLHKKDQFVYALSVGKNHIYWTDWNSHTVYSLPKNGSQSEPTALRRFSHAPMAVIVFDERPLDCHLVMGMQRTRQFTTAASSTTVNLPVYTDALAVQDTLPVHNNAVDTNETVPVYNNNEEQLCAGYCLNGGRCYLVNGDPTCICLKNYSGIRCDEEIVENAPEISCPEVFLPAFYDRTVLIVLVSLTITCVILLALVVYLTFRVRKLMDMRFKRRKLSAKAGKLEGHAGTVINVDNCCNMNICETPCCEPSTASNRTPASEKQGRTGDKHKLLNCEF